MKLSHPNPCPLSLFPQLSVDVVATSEVSISVTLDPAKYYSRDLFAEELESLRSSMEPVGKVPYCRSSLGSTWLFTARGLCL